MGPWSPARSPARIPDAPGSYQFLDAEGRVIYVGKAKSLRSRLSNYFAPPATLSERTYQMVQAADRVEWIVVEERGRGVLPRVQPHQAAQAPVQHPAEGRQVVSVPRGHARRGVAAGDGDARPAPQGRPLLRALRARVRDPGDARPAAAHVPDPDVHELEVRPAPPARPAVPLRAHREVRGAVRRRHRRTTSTCGSSRSSSTSSTASTTRSLHRLEERMRHASDELEFELAARVRDQLASVRKAIERQQMVGTREEDYDLIGLAEDELEASVQVFYVRKGRVVGRKGLIVDKVEDVETPALIARVVEQLYADARREDIPKEILVPVEPEDRDALRGVPRAQPRLEGAHPRAAAGQQARAARDRDAQRPGVFHAAQAPARVRPQRAGARACRAAGGARTSRRRRCGSSASTSRTSRAPRSSASMVVMEDGLAEALRLPPVQGEDARPARRLRVDGGGADAPLPQLPPRARRRRARRASASRTRRTCSWSTAARASSASRCACSKSSGSKTSASRASPRSSRRCTSPARASRFGSRATRRRCTSCNRCATRRTASRSRTTASCAARR